MTDNSNDFATLTNETEYTEVVDTVVESEAVADDNETEEAEIVETVETPNTEKVVIPTKFKAEETFKPVLLKKYNEEIAPALQAKFNYTSSMQIPRINKIVINMGVGDATTNSKLLEAAIAE